MGNGCCFLREQNSKGFTSEQYIILNHLYNDLCLCQLNLGNVVTINENFIKPLFSENLILAERIYTLMKHFNPNDEGSINIDTFITAVRILIKGLDNTARLSALTEMNPEKIDVLAMMYVNKYDVPYHILQMRLISYQDAMEFFQIVFNMLMFNYANSSKISSIFAIQILMNSLFGLIDENAKSENNISIEWSYMMTYLKRNLIYLNDNFSIYYENKFLHYGKPIKLRLPILDHISYIVDLQNMMPILCMTNKYIQNVSILRLIYRFDVDLNCFDDLANALLNYNFATLMLLRLVIPIPGNPMNSKKYVIGAFTKMRWREGFGSDMDACLYDILPKFKIIPTADLGISDNLYLNLDSTTNGRSDDGTYKGNKGLGFGDGKKPKNFKLWLDGMNDHIETTGFINGSEESYEKDFLAERYLNDVKIDYIEVWGLGMEFTLSIESQKTRETISKERITALQAYRNSTIRHSTSTTPTTNTPNKYRQKKEILDFVNQANQVLSSERNKKKMPS